MDLNPQVNSSFTYSLAVPIHCRPVQGHFQMSVYKVCLIHTQTHTYHLCDSVFMCHMLSTLSVAACGLFPFMPLTNLISPGTLSDK